MNEQLLTILEIDKGLGLDDMIEALEEKYCEYLEREQTATSPERKSEISDIIKKIEKEIQNLKENKKSINSAIVLDTGDNQPSATTEKNKEKKTADESEKIAAMKQKKAELKAVEEKKKAEQQNSVASVTTQSNSVSTGGSTGTGSVQLTGDNFQDAIAYYNQNMFTKALLLFSEESEKGNAQAQFFLGIMYRDGKGASQDLERSRFWLKKSADNGCIASQITYGISLINESNSNAGITNEALRYFAMAADSGDQSAMQNYVNTVILKNTDKKTIAKAMDYCDKIVAASDDSFEKDQFQKKKSQLKALKKSKKSKLSCGGCLVITLVTVVGILAIAYMVWLIEESENNKPASPVETTVAADTSVFGEEIVNIRELQPEEEQQVTMDYEGDYVVDDSLWNDMFIYRAGNGESTAYAIYDIGGHFEKIKFEATPWIGDGYFHTGSTADIMIINSETNDILHTQTIDYNSGVVEVEADITGVNKLGIYVKKTSTGLGNLGYTFIRNVYIYPAGTAEETSDSYRITGNIRSGAGMEYDIITASDGTKEYIATGNKVENSDGSGWYEVYIDEDKTTTGWCHSSIAEKQ